MSFLQFLLLIHVCGAVVGLLSGSLAMIFRKGSGLHRAGGTVFFVSMLIMSACAAYVAFARAHALNALDSSLTFYLVATGWITVKRQENKTDAIDWIGLLMILAIATAILANGFDAAASPARSKGGYAAPLYFIFGIIAMLFAAGDMRMLVQRGVSGARRIARHLVRMCTALLFALLSAYPGQARLFPPAWRESNLLFLPAILVAGAMIFWRWRVTHESNRPLALRPARQPQV